VRPSKDEIGILKSIWRKNGARAWAIRLGGGDDYQPELVASVGSVTPNAKIPGKMSGSPIITNGIVGRSLGSTDNHASGCLIAPMMNLPLVGDKSLLDLMNGGNEGIAKMIGSGL
jgi:hypothetical protein